MVRYMVRVVVAVIILASLGGSLPTSAQANSDAVNVDYVGWYLASNGTDVDKVALSFDTNLIIGKYEVIVELLDNDKGVVSSGNRVFSNLDKKDKLIIDLSDVSVAIVYYIRVTVKRLPAEEYYWEGPPPPPLPPAGTTDVRGQVSTTGVFIRSITAISEDGLYRLTIPEGTVGLTEELECLTEISMLIMDEPPPPPKAAHIVGLACDFGPDGATFDPPITLEYTYDPAEIPEGVAEEDLVLAYYDEASGEWVELDCVVDTENDTITALVSHFTTFAIIARAAPPPPPLLPPPAPAAFSVSDLSIQPAEVLTGEAVSITASVANNSGTAGSYTVVLNINGVKETEKSVTIATGESQDVTFSVTKEDAARYSVTVDGLSGSFTVTAPTLEEVAPPEEEVAPPEEEEVVPEAPAINWPLTGGIIAAVVVAGLLSFFLIRRKAH